MDEVRPEIDQERCTACGTCVETCRFEVLKLRKAGAAPCGIGTCIACGHCVAVCPAGAVSHPLMPAGEIVELPAEPAVSLDDLTDLLRRRRSVRRYTDEPVPEGVLRDLVAAAILAPSGHNLQPWEFTFAIGGKLDEIRAAAAEYYRGLLQALADDERRRGLVAAAGEGFVQAMDSLSPALMLMVREHDRGGDRLLWGAPVLAMVHAPQGALAAEASCTYAAANMMLAATAQGFGTCPIGFLGIPATADPSFTGVLGLPDRHVLHVGMTLGRPATRYRRSVVRREPPITII